MRRGVRAALIVVLLFAGAACAGLLALAAMFLSFVTSLEESSNPPPLPGRRTVVLVAIDDLRSDHLRPCGYRFDPAPALTALAQAGAAAEGYRSASAATSASLASLLTGLPPAEHGLLSARELGAHRLAASVETLPEVLAAQGWRTLGSVSLRQLQGRYSGLDQGFESWRAAAPAGGGPLPAADVVAAVEPELAEALLGDADVFLFLHFGDLREEGAGTEFLERHLAPFSAAEPAIGAALERAAGDPAGALADLELLLGRRRGDPALQALRAARYDARLAEVDRALQGLLERLRGAGFGRAEPVVVVAGTRGRVLAGGLDGAANAGAEDLLGTALVAGGPGVGAAWRRAATPLELMGLLRADLSLGEAPRPPGSAAGGAIGWRLELAAPAGVSVAARVRLGSPEGEIAALAGGAGAVRSPAGTSAETLLSAPGALAVECARRTAPLALVATGLGRWRAVVVAGADGAQTLLPCFPPAAEGVAEGAAPRVVVERDGSWARVSVPGAPAGSRVALALWAYPPEPFGAAPELALEPGADTGRSFPGLDAALVEGRGPLAARLRLRAGQRLAVAATLDGAAVEPGEMTSDEGGAPGDLSLYLPPAGVAALPVSGPGNRSEPAELRATRLYPGPPMEPAYDLDDDDVRFLQRLGPLE